MSGWGKLRAAFRLARCAVHLAGAAGTVALVYPWAKRGLRLRLKQRWSRQLLGVLGVRLTITGAAARPRTLLVANHVSWLDIFVINAFVPATFICKADVRNWPLIGWLVANTDTVFIERGRRTAAQHTLRGMQTHLAAGSCVAVFPEGTTTDGRCVLPFHGALLQSAAEPGTAVQPVVIRYADGDGVLSSAPAYYADVTLWQSLKAIALAHRLVARAEFLPPIEHAHRADRRTLAAQLHAIISNRLARLGAGSAYERPADPPSESPSAFHPTDNLNRAPAGPAPA